MQVKRYEKNLKIISSLEFSSVQMFVYCITVHLIMSPEIEHNVVIISQAVT